MRAPQHRTTSCAVAVRPVPHDDRSCAARSVCPLSDVRRRTRSAFADTDWPANTDLRITAIDAHTGSLETFDAAGQVTLAEAVAASCAVPIVWPPASAAGRRWIDGGSRAPANVHLASGYRRVLVVAPLTAALGPHPSASSRRPNSRPREPTSCRCPRTVPPVAPGDAT
ncbi:patatin-like phospholipase family protein [Streptomyces sp. NPDC055134]